MLKKKRTLFIFIVFSLVIFLASCLPKKSVEQPIKVEESQKTFTLQERSRHDGEQGQPAYVAVDGIVYDVSQIFKEGAHYEHLAGKELTKELYSQHVKAQIEKYPLVGRLVDSP